MMLSTTSTLLASNSADGGGGAAAVAAAEAHDSGGGAGFSDEERGGDRGSGGGGGNRWPRQETIALLKIRSEMGVAFRDSSLKGPLWEEVSRKMAELGYQRNAKKCKEKFENVYKYHRRTKEGRASKPDGKSYRFFEQLEALEKNPSLHHLPPPPPPQPQQPPPSQSQTAGIPMPMPHVVSTTTVSSPNPVSFSPASVNNPPQLAPQPLPPPKAVTANAVNNNNNNIPAMTSNLMMSDSTSNSSTSSDEEDIGRRHKKRKRKLKDLFDRIMKDVMDKQEEMQRKFLETLEKRERDRMIREEAWRVQEMSRMNRELDLLAQERSMSSAKDSAIMQFLQKITSSQPQQNPQTTLPPVVPLISVPNIHLQQPISVAAAPPSSTAVLAPVAPPVEVEATPLRNLDRSKSNNGGGGGENYTGASSSRWPKTEVEALINLRTNLDMKYEDNGPKGPLWEEISAGMSKLGYTRNAKRCKEKWENINKYFKKVKESNKKRPEDSKTCPYFHQLEALYKEKNNKGDISNSYSSSMALPIMATPEQQWPQIPAPPLQQEEDHESDNNMDDDDEEEDEGGEYEIVTNNKGSSNSMATTTTAAS